MNDNAGSGDPGNPVMTRGRLRDLTATYLRSHEGISEVSYTNPKVDDTLGMLITATDRERFRMWITRDEVAS